MGSLMWHLCLVISFTLFSGVSTPSFGDPKEIYHQIKDLPDDQKREVLETVDQMKGLPEKARRSRSEIRRALYQKIGSNKRKGAIESLEMAFATLESLANPNSGVVHNGEFSPLLDALALEFDLEENPRKREVILQFIEKITLGVRLDQSQAERNLKISHTALKKVVHFFFKILENPSKQHSPGLRVIALDALIRIGMVHPQPIRKLAPRIEKLMNSAEYQELHRPLSYQESYHLGDPVHRLEVLRFLATPKVYEAEFKKHAPEKAQNRAERLTGVDRRQHVLTIIRMLAGAVAETQFAYGHLPTHGEAQRIHSRGIRLVPMSQFRRLIQSLHVPGTLLSEAPPKERDRRIKGATFTHRLASGLLQHSRLGTIAHGNFTPIFLSSAQPPLNPHLDVTGRSYTENETKAYFEGMSPPRGLPMARELMPIEDLERVLSLTRIEKLNHRPKTLSNHGKELLNALRGLRPVRGKTRRPPPKAK